MEWKEIYMYLGSIYWLLWLLEVMNKNKVSFFDLGLFINSGGVYWDMDWKWRSRFVELRERRCLYLEIYILKEVEVLVDK